MYQFNPTEVQATVEVLKQQLGIRSRADFERKVGSRSGAIDIDGIGRERARIVRALHRANDLQWLEVTGLPVEDEEAQPEIEVPVSGTEG